MKSHRVTPANYTPWAVALRQAATAFGRYADSGVEPSDSRDSEGIRLNATLLGAARRYAAAANAPQWDAIRRIKDGLRAMADEDIRRHCASGDYDEPEVQLDAWANELDQLLTSVGANASPKKAKP